MHRPREHPVSSIAIDIASGTSCLARAPSEEVLNMRSVLVVDDDADIREVIAYKLELGGFAVRLAADGVAGLAAARAAVPDLVLVDWMMPRLTGVEVCRELRRDPETAGVPIILLTARARDTDVRDGFAAGADDYVVKPFSPRELLRRVEAVFA
jgi:DNA-binding response OmpR family regulator